MLLMDDRQDIEARALAHAAEHERRHGKPFAEILTDKGEWFMLRVTPGRESAVAGHLSGLRFGTFLPMAKRTKEGKEYPIFPGYLFVFVWDMEAQWRRIRAVPDVNGLVPVGVTDGDISWLRLEEAKHFAQTHKVRTKRRRKEPADVIVESVRGYVGGIDTDSRLTLFWKALGLRVEPLTPRVAGGRSPKGR